MIPPKHVGRSIGRSATTRSRLRKSEYFKGGDLVLVNIYLGPAWPAQVSDPAYFKKSPDNYRHFVQLFGRNEQVFVEPSDMEHFNGEIKLRPRGRPSKLKTDFEKAVEEIKEAYDRKRKASLRDAQQTNARLEKGKGAAGDENMDGVSQSKQVKDSTTSMKTLIELAYKEKPKEKLKVDVSKRTPSIGPVQPRADLSTGDSLSTEANKARDEFKVILEGLSRTEGSIGHATDLAFKCADNEIASEVIELIREKLENGRMHKKVKFIFLVDSIMQSSQKQRGTGASFISIVQNQLPRLLQAAAPLRVGRPRQIHKHCAKILRLWIKREIMPKSLLQPYLDDIQSFVGQSSQTDRSVNGGAREIYGLLIDEYGSNDKLELPGHMRSQVFVREGIPNIPCDQNLEKKGQKEVLAKENDSARMERNSPPSPPDSPPLTPPMPSSPMPLLPPGPPSPPPPPPGSPPLTPSPPPGSPPLTPPMSSSPMPLLPPGHPSPPPPPPGSPPLTPPPPPGSPPLTPLSPHSMMPPLPHYPPSLPPPLSPLPYPIQSSDFQRPPPPILGTWGQSMMSYGPPPYGQPPACYNFWRRA